MTLDRNYANRPFLERLAESTIEVILETYREADPEKVELWDDEWEQWHITDKTPTDENVLELPASIIAAYRFSSEVWQAAQAIVTKAVEEAIESVLDGKPAELRNPGWVSEWLRGEITKAELEARLEPCPHPEDLIVQMHGRLKRCNRCRLLIPISKVEE